MAKNYEHAVAKLNKMFKWEKNHQKCKFTRQKLKKGGCNGSRQKKQANFSIFFLSQYLWWSGLSNWQMKIVRNFWVFWIVIFCIFLSKKMSQLEAENDFSRLKVDENNFLNETASIFFESLIKNSKFLFTIKKISVFKHD